MNGDGYADVIVGAVRYDNGQTDEGRAFVYHGSAAGLSATARLDGGERPGGRLLRLLRGDGRGRERGRLLGRDRRGVHVTTTARPTRAGRSSITARRRGSSATPPGRRRATRRAPTSAARSSTAGDVNGDGYADVIVGALLLRQRPDRRGAGVRLPRLGGGALGRPPPGRRRATRPAPTSAARWRRRGT